MDSVDLRHNWFVLSLHRFDDSPVCAAAFLVRHAHALSIVEDFERWVAGDALLSREGLVLFERRVDGRHPDCTRLQTRGCFLQLGC